MKITTNKLRQIIREELSRVLEQPSPARLSQLSQFQDPIQTAKEAFPQSDDLNKRVRQQWLWWAKDRGTQPSGKVHADVVVKNMRIVSFTVNEDQDSAYRSLTKNVLNAMKGESGKPPAVVRNVPDGTYEVRVSFGS